MISLKIMLGNSGHSPMRPTVGSINYDEEKIATSAVLQQPLLQRAKRNKTTPELVELDSSLADTTKSTHCGAKYDEDKKKSKRMDSSDSWKFYN